MQDGEGSLAGEDVTEIESRWLAIEELAKYLHLSVRGIYEWRQGRVGPPAFKVGRRLLWDRDEVDAWIRSQRVRQP